MEAHLNSIRTYQGGNVGENTLIINTLNELIDLFKPGGILDEFRKKGYVFRGEADSTWKLIPNLLRNGNSTKLHEAAYNICYIDDEDEKNEITPEIYLRKEEAYVLNKFYECSNINGLKIPNVDIYSQKGSNINDEWYSEGYQEIASLAQHYGMYTRMLDWTYDIFVALFFAFRERLKKTDLNGNVRIWILNKNYIEIDNFVPLKFVRPPYYSNKNISAQKGLLSYWKMKGIYEPQNNTINSKPIDVLLFEYYKDLIYPIIGMKFEHILDAIEINPKICSEGIRWLDSIGYNAARIFPGYVGVKEYIYDDRYLYAEENK